MTAVRADEFGPDWTRAELGGWRRVEGGVRWNRGGRALKGGSGEAVRRNADGRPIGLIVRLHLDHVSVLGEGRGELRCSERTAKHGRIRKHGILLEIDIIVFRAEVNIVKGDVEGRRIVGS